VIGILGMIGQFQQCDVCGVAGPKLFLVEGAGKICERCLRAGRIGELRERGDQPKQEKGSED